MVCGCPEHVGRTSNEAETIGIMSLAFLKKFVAGVKGRPDRDQASLAVVQVITQPYIGKIRGAGGNSEITLDVADETLIRSWTRCRFRESTTNQKGWTEMNAKVNIDSKQASAVDTLAACPESKT
jgi:hypothetical protein